MYQCLQDHSSIEYLKIHVCNRKSSNNNNLHEAQQTPRVEGQLITENEQRIIKVLEDYLHTIQEHDL